MHNHRKFQNVISNAKSNLETMIFEDNNDSWQRLDFRIIQRGWISLYSNESILSTDINWFKKENYKIIEFECENWLEEILMFNEINRKLKFPEYFGYNYDALNDCLSDIIIENSGLVIVFRNIDSGLNIDTIHNILDTFVTNARLHFLFGKRMIILVQVSNSRINIKPVGSYPICWNDKEWLISDRI
jgi:RNAse (barnase) inhibitor barstar